MEQLEHILRATVFGFQTSLNQHMPLSVYRTFHTWALSPKNPQHKSWTQMLGFPQMAKLTHLLLGNSVSAEQWDELVRYTTYLNAYLIYEAVSDNLAFGLAVRRPGDTTYDQRREILVSFNNAMIARLNGQHVESEAILSAIQFRMHEISGFQHSMTNDEQWAIAEVFLSQHPQYKMEDIEFGTWNALVANIRSCAAAADEIAHLRLGDYFRQGLIARYEAVNALLQNTVTDQETLIQVSTNTILVIPVLTYYVAVLEEVLNVNPALEALIESGVLFEALEDAALLTRLLNDMGTNLVAAEQFPMHLLNELYTQLTGLTTHVSALIDLLSQYSEGTAIMTRIRKDLSFAEYNVSLHDLMTAPATPMSLLLFSNNLLYFQDYYKQRKSRLKRNLHTIAQVLGRDVASGLIGGFVRFHEHIYQYQFDTQDGDYATKPDVRAAG